MDHSLATKLVGCLSQKASFLDDIASATAEQTALIGLEDINPLLDNIERRQTLIDQINMLDREIAAIATEMGQPQQTPQWQELSTQLAALNDRMREKLLEIDANDKHNEKLATQLLESFQKDLRTVRQGMRSVNAYANVPQSEQGSYIDKKNV